jgi:two-component system, chemotaxis family, sensor kinase Cph1
MQPSDTANVEDFVASEPIDLSNCDREPIHIPGLIQPHGLLLTLGEPKLEILQISENVEHFLGIPAEKLLGKPLNYLCSKTKVQEICQYLQQDNLEVFSPLQLRIRSFLPSSTQQKTQSQNFRAILHRSDGLLVMELKPSKIAQSQEFIKFYHVLKEAIAKLTQF